MKKFNFRNEKIKLELFKKPTEKQGKTNLDKTFPGIYL